MKRLRDRQPSEAALAATRSTFVALNGILDERQIKTIYEARGSSRPPVKLDEFPRQSKHYLHSR